MVVPFLIFMMYDSSFYYLIALIILSIAAATDYLDGMIARRRNQVSLLGKLIDPLADKLLISTAFVYFVSIERLDIPVWAVVVIIAREFTINGLRTIAASKGSIIAASYFGKLKTVIQLTAVFLILVMLIKNQYLNFAAPLTALVAVVTAATGAVYIIENKGILNDNQEDI